MRRNLRQYPGLGRDLFVRFVAQAGEAVTAHHDVEAAAAPLHGLRGRDFRAALQGVAVR